MSACCRTLITSDGFRTNQYGPWAIATAKDVLNQLGIVDVALPELFIMALTESLTAKKTDPAGTFESNVNDMPL